MPVPGARSGHGDLAVAGSAATILLRPGGRSGVSLSPGEGSRSSPLRAHGRRARDARNLGGRPHGRAGTRQSRRPSQQAGEGPRTWRCLQGCVRSLYKDVADKMVIEGLIQQHAMADFARAVGSAPADARSAAVAYRAWALADPHVCEFAARRPLRRDIVGRSRRSRGRRCSGWWAATLMRRMRCFALGVDPELLAPTRRNA